jgi:SAM-dependent methyltransferase
MATEDAETVRERLLDGWERSAGGWGERADDVRAMGMPVSAWLMEALALQPGQTVLELAAGPGDTGFMAAELIRPGGTLICSDGAEAMLQIARERATALGIDNVDFKQLQLEWIDLPTASVDAALCRWGVMLIVDPAAALHEVRRVVKPGGRFALAVWDGPAANPWATIPGRALVELGHAEPPDPDAPGMFALAAPGRLRGLLEGAGFQEAVLDALALERRHATPDEYLEYMLGLARPFREAFEQLGEGARGVVRDRIAELAQQYAEAGGGLRFSASSLVAAATA